MVCRLARIHPGLFFEFGKKWLNSPVSRSSRKTTADIVDLMLMTADEKFIEEHIVPYVAGFCNHPQPLEVFPHISSWYIIKPDIIPFTAERALAALLPVLSQWESPSQEKLLALIANCENTPMSVLQDFMLEACQKHEGSMDRIKRAFNILINSRFYENLRKAKDINTARFYAKIAPFLAKAGLQDEGFNIIAARFAIDAPQGEYVCQAPKYDQSRAHMEINPVPQINSLQDAYAYAHMRLAEDLESAGISFDSYGSGPGQRQISANVFYYGFNALETTRRIPHGDLHQPFSLAVPNNRLTEDEAMVLSKHIIGAYLQCLQSDDPMLCDAKRVMERWISSTDENMDQINLSLYHCIDAVIGHVHTPFLPLYHLNEAILMAPFDSSQGLLRFLQALPFHQYTSITYLAQNAAAGLYSPMDCLLLLDWMDGGESNIDQEHILAKDNLARRTILNIVVGGVLQGTVYGITRNVGDGLSEKFLRACEKFGNTVGYRSFSERVWKAERIIEQEGICAETVTRALQTLTSPVHAVAVRLGDSERQARLRMNSKYTEGYQLQDQIDRNWPDGSGVIHMPFNTQAGHSGDIWLKPFNDPACDTAGLVTTVEGFVRRLAQLNPA
jgi:hypothetical protein